MKRNNCFISELGEEFMFYSAFVRSFDSAFGHVLERMGNEHILIELKALGDLDNKKAQAEKKALLNEYFMVLNKVKEDKNATVKIYFGTAYNKFGEGQEWKQANVRNFFADEELLTY